MKNKKDLRIIFLGTPDFAVNALEALLANDFNVVAVVTNIDKKSGRGMKLSPSAVKTFAIENKIPVLQPPNLKSPAFLDELASYQADVQVVVAFRMLPVAVWDMPPLGTINIHASLLPHYRGAAPIHWAIINGEKESGITTFQLKHAIDTGDILLQHKIMIEPTDTVGSLHDKLALLGGKTICETLNQLCKGTLKSRAQDFLPTDKVAPKIFKEDTIIDWEQEAEQIYNFIRGMNPFPAAKTSLQGKEFKVFKAEICDAIPNARAGEIASDGKHFLKVQCKQGAIALLELQLQGKKRMSIEDFLRGNKV